MAREFPKLEDGQVTVLRAERATGIVLDEQFKRAISDEQKIFTIFENVSKAIEYSECAGKERLDIELIIYNGQENIIYHVNK